MRCCYKFLTCLIICLLITNCILILLDNVDFQYYLIGNAIVSLIIASIYLDYKPGPILALNIASIIAFIGFLAFVVIRVNEIVM